MLITTMVGVEMHMCQFRRRGWKWSEMSGFPWPGPEGLMAGMTPAGVPDDLAHNVLCDGPLKYTLCNGTCFKGVVLCHWTENGKKRKNKARI